MINQRFMNFWLIKGRESTGTLSNSSSNTSGDDGRLEILQKIQEDRHGCVTESFVSSNNDNTRATSPQALFAEKSFDVITHETNPSRRNSFEYGVKIYTKFISSYFLVSSVSNIDILFVIRSDHCEHRALQYRRILDGSGERGGRNR